MTSPLVIDSIDGAEHQKSKKKVRSVTSFSTSIACPTALKKGDTTSGSSKNALTWKQARGTESIFTTKPSVNNNMVSKHTLKEEQENSSPPPFEVEEEVATTDEGRTLSLNHQNCSKCFYYELNDGKMLCLLTQHGLYIRKNNPFLICTCEKG